MVELYYGCTMVLDNLVAFPKATMKLQTVKGGSSIENLMISFNFVQVSAFVTLRAIYTFKGSKETSKILLLAQST